MVSTGGRVAYMLYWYFPELIVIGYLIVSNRICRHKLRKSVVKSTGKWVFLKYNIMISIMMKTFRRLHDGKLQNRMVLHIIIVYYFTLQLVFHILWCKFCLKSTQKLETKNIFCASTNHLNTSSLKSLFHLEKSIIMVHLYFTRYHIASSLITISLSSTQLLRSFY